MVEYKIKYYNPLSFRVINEKKNTLTKKTIALCKNASWRNPEAVIFDNEIECKQFFEIECNKQIDFYKNLINNI